MKKKGVIISLVGVLLVVCAASVWAMTRNQETKTATSTTSNSSSQTTMTSSSEEEDNITTMIDKMSLEEKVGQLFFARTPQENQVSDLEDYHLGGYVLFGEDTENATKESLQEKVQSFQEASDIPDRKSVV